jgi:hypothetical protein
VKRRGKSELKYLSNGRKEDSISQKSPAERQKQYDMNTDA